jgi:hypothetical protein
MFEVFCADWSIVCRCETFEGAKDQVRDFAEMYGETFYIQDSVTEQLLYTFSPLTK